MEHVYLWAPWSVVAALVLFMLWDRRDAVAWPAVVIEALLVVAGYAAYYIVRGATAGDTAAAIDNAREIIDLQQWLRIYWEPEVQDFVLRYDRFTVFWNWTYIWWHWPLIITASVWLYLNKRPVYAVYRDAFLLSGAVGLLFFAFLPVAPPRLADPDIVDTIAVHSDIYRTYEAPRFVNQYAAFPSLHFAWNLLVSIALVRETRHPLARAIGVLSPPVVVFAIAVTGNHFIIDAVAGGVLAVAALVTAHRWRLIGLPPGRRPPPFD